MAEKVIEDAILHIEVEEENKIFVRGIAETGNKDRKWYLFKKDDQLPSAHPLMEKYILKLRVKNF